MSTTPDPTDSGRLAAAAPGRCPFCREAFVGPGGVVACAACGARHHEPCWDELQRCATCSSRDVLVARGARQRPAPRPAESLVMLTHAGDALEVSWPFVPPTQVGTTRGCGAAALGLGALLLILAVSAGPAILALPALGAAAFGLLVLRWLARHRDARCTVRLEPERLSFRRPGSAFERLELDAPRGSVDAVGLDENGTYLQVHVDGKARAWIGSAGVGNVLPRPTCAGCSTSSPRGASACSTCGRRARRP